LIASLIVTAGFFAGVVLDPDVASSHATAAISSSRTASLGILSGAASSVLSAFHAILIKKGLVRLR
jgi:GDP-fucose transporter C1